MAVSSDERIKDMRANVYANRISYQAQDKFKLGDAVLPFPPATAITAMVNQGKNGRFTRVGDLQSE